MRLGFEGALEGAAATIIRGSAWSFEALFFTAWFLFDGIVNWDSCARHIFCENCGLRSTQVS